MCVCVCVYADLMNMDVSLEGDEIQVVQASIEMIKSCLSLQKVKSTLSPLHVAGRPLATKSEVISLRSDVSI